MTRAALGLDDFIIAARTGSPDRGEEVREPEESDKPHIAPAVQPTAGTILPKLSQEARRQKITTGAIVKEDARLALRHLRRAKERDAKFYVNVALDYETKTRLKKAAHENDVNMTIIMQAAINLYLKDNGY